MKIMLEKEVPARRAAGKTWQGVNSRLRQQGGVGQRVTVHKSFQTSSVLAASCTLGQARAHRARHVHIGPGACTSGQRRECTQQESEGTLSAVLLHANVR